jgi:hypothetical protein
MNNRSICPTNLLHSSTPLLTDNCSLHRSAIPYNTITPAKPMIAINPGTANPPAPLVALAAIELPVAETVEFLDPEAALDPVALALPEIFAPALPVAVVVAEAEPVLEEEEADEVMAIN